MADEKQRYGTAGSSSSKEARQALMSRQEEVRNNILSQALDQQARARLNIMKISRPQKAAMFENMVVQMAQTGQIISKLEDAQFVKILEQINAEMSVAEPQVKYDRRRSAIDSDEEEIE